MTDSMNEYWGRENLEGRILEALTESGKDLNALTVDDLAPLDQYHGGSKAMTLRLARLAELVAGAHVLDVGGGLGGPARLLASEFGCRVTVVDPTESYISAGRALTQRLGLDDRVDHKLGDGLNLPFDDGSFDVRLDSEQRHEHPRKGASLRRVSPSSAWWRDVGYTGADGWPCATANISRHVGKRSFEQLLALAK